MIMSRTMMKTMVMLMPIYGRNDGKQYHGYLARHAINIIEKDEQDDVHNRQVLVQVQVKVQVIISTMMLMLIWAE